MTPDQTHLLHIYLRDHDAAAVGGLQLSQQCTDANRGTRYFTELQRLTADIRSDRDALRAICGDFGVHFSRVGRAIAFSGAKLGRLKTNGRVFKYSPLSRVIELEAFSSGVMSKLRLWESLLLLAKTEQRLDETEMSNRIMNANEQLIVIGRLHDMAADEAFR
jgi:hypothetical protein